jgi:hypothetical protein
MSRVFVSNGTGATVYVFSNDHCPPHVSARHRGEEWIARIQFSYLSEAVRLWSIEPIGNAPTQRAINRLLDEVQAQLAACRRAWWETQQTACLEGQWIVISQDGLITPTESRGPEAKQIVRAIYDADTKRLWVEFSDGTTAERIET